MSEYPLALLTRHPRLECCSQTAILTDDGYSEVLCILLRVLKFRLSLLFLSLKLFEPFLAVAILSTPLYPT